MPGPSMACLSSHASSPIDGQRKGFDAGLVQAAHLELFDRLVCGPADGLHLWRCARVIGPPPPASAMAHGHARTEALHKRNSLPEPKRIPRKPKRPPALPQQTDQPCLSDGAGPPSTLLPCCLMRIVETDGYMARAWVGTVPGPANRLATNITSTKGRREL
jgi:hypothetical protein